jgi:uncharacterized phiE125 gp8 family phage protein
MHLHTDDVLKSPVFPSELVAFARLDEDDPLIETVLLSATHAVFAFLKQDLLTRTWTLTHRYWPTSGTGFRSSIIKQLYANDCYIDLPYTNLIGIDSVLVCGEASTDYLINPGKPYSIEFNNYSTSSDQNALVVTYKAGFGDNTADIPQPIRNAIMMAAGYIHAHNGACDYTDALTSSGAKQLLIPYAVKAGIVI